MPAGEVNVAGAEEPCTGEFDPFERRAYGGVMASKLAGMAEKLVTCRLLYGIGTYFHAFVSLTDKIQHALYIYTRVKDAMKAFYAPENIDLPVNHDGHYLVSHTREPQPKFTWGVTPRDTYKSGDVFYTHGQDMRSTSLLWIERRARQVKTRARHAARQAYIQEHNIQVAQSRPMKRACRTGTTSVQKVCKPLPLILGEIWPPVPIPSKVDVVITVTPVLYPRPEKDIIAMGRKVGFEHAYRWYYEDAENMAKMWTGDAEELRQLRCPARDPP